MARAIKKKPIYAVFDIGKTNKKLILFDEERQIISEHLHVCTDDYDEDGYACDHLPRLTQWVQAHWLALRQDPHYSIKGVNFTAYGAAWVHLDAGGEALLPLYSYQRPLPQTVEQQFFAELGQSPEEFALATRSPYLGMLSAGLQLYWLKHRQPEKYARIHTSLFLAQYLSYIITGDKYSDYSSVGCHTALWDFDRQDYHAWVYREGIDEKLAPLIKDSVSTVTDGILIGVGMHDSSAAVITHLFEEEEPFVLVATGTWCVAFNPFNKQALTPDLLGQGCVNYMSPRGEPMLASRLPLGQLHDVQAGRIARHFQVPPDFYQAFELAWPVAQLTETAPLDWRGAASQQAEEAGTEAGTEWPLATFATATAAYQHLMYALVNRLQTAIAAVRQAEGVILVDGGFARNPLFMQNLSRCYPDVQIRTLEIPQATAIGALIHLEQGEARKKTQPLFD